MTRPRFAPNVAFLETPTHHPIAVVSWRGERVELRDVFVPETSPPRTARLVSLEYDPLRRVVEGRLAGSLRFGSALQATASIIQQVGLNDARVNLPSLWLGVQRRL